jgi:hypothetical protein
MSLSQPSDKQTGRQPEPYLFNIHESYVPKIPGQVKQGSEVLQKYPSLIRKACYIASPLCRKLVDINVPLKTPTPFTLIKGSESKFLTKKYGWYEAEQILEEYVETRSGLVSVTVDEILAGTDSQGKARLVAHFDERSSEDLNDEFAASEDFLLSHGAKPFQRKYFQTLTIASFDSWPDCSKAQKSIMSFLTEDTVRSLLQIEPAELVSPFQS